MLKRRISAILVVAVISVILIPVFSRSVNAAGASLFLSPATGKYEVGKTFTVRVMVNSGGGVGINAAEATINYDPAIVLVSKVSEASSIFELWTQKPTFANKNGTISFGGGAPSAYTGSAGAIMSITFIAKSAGTATVTFSSGIVLAADGKGTNVYTGGGQGVYEIGAAAEVKPEETKKPEEIKKPEEKPKGTLPSLPDITSPTHPDENKWYANNNPEFEWKLFGDVNGVSILITDSPTSDPGANSDGIIENKKFDNVQDGIKYLHVKYKNTVGWGPILHRKILIDTKAPSPFEIIVDNEGDPTNPKPILVFATTDNASGIDKYSVVMDGAGEDVSPRNFKTDPFRTKVLTPGNHSVQVVAADRAGNRASSTRDFIVEPLKLPVITELPKFINKGDVLIVRGTSFYPQATINISLGSGGKEFDSARVKTDDDGNWSFFRKKELDKGAYEIWAKVIDARGAESNNTEKEAFSVITPSLLAQWGWLIIIILLIIIIGLVLTIIYMKKKYDETMVRIKEEVEETKGKIDEVFLALKEEVEELVEFADRKPGFSESEQRVRDKLKEALDISEEFITKEITDVEKEVK